MSEIVLSTTPGGTNAQSVFITKTVTFTGAAGLGAAGAVPWFTITGQVHVVKICGRILVNTAGTAGDTLALGITGATTLFIAATTTANLQAATPVWVDASPSVGEAIPAACKDVQISANIIGTVAGTAFTAVYRHRC
jgi:hypothetical protein